MCSRVFKAMVFFAALALAMAVGAVLGGGAVYLLTRPGDAHPVVEISAVELEPGQRARPVVPHRLPVWGAVVIEVVQGSSAAAAGLQEGDVISALDGEPIIGPHLLVERIAQREPGDEVELTVYRLGSRASRNVRVTLGEHPTKEGKAYLGVWLDGPFFPEK